MSDHIDDANEITTAVDDGPWECPECGQMVEDFAWIGGNLASEACPECGSATDHL